MPTGNLQFDYVPSANAAAATPRGMGTLIVDEKGQLWTPDGVGGHTKGGTGGGITALNQASDYNANLVTPLSVKVNSSSIGAANGVASLGADAKVPTAQMTGKLATTDLTDGAALNTAVSNHTTSIAANTAALSVQTTDAQTGTSYTLVLADAGQNVDMNNASANTLTIPPNSSVAFPIGTVITVTMAGAGVTTIAPGAGVTIVKPSARSLSVSAQYETAQLYKSGTDTWRVLCG